MAGSENENGGSIMKYNAIYPGKIWFDTNGKRIQVHGGSVRYENGTYYFYGENKEFTDGKNDVVTWGVRCYASKDLYNWEDIGLIIEPELEDKSSPLHPSMKAERPHIIYNRKTQKYICFMKVIMKDGSQRTTILSADNFFGPYKIEKHGLLPLGGSAGDFDLQVDEETGKAYYIFERVHTHTVIAELTDDYLGFNGKYSEHFKNGHPPHVREAAAHFIRDGKHYLITSGTTGYYPNPSELAVADDWHGPYRVLGNPHPDDMSNTSYHSQISSVFKVEGKKDLYIACADRWLPDEMFLPYKEYADLFDKEYNPNSKEKADWQGMFEKYEGVHKGPANTSISDYVWLPFRFDGEMGYLDWHDEWKTEEYE